MKFNPPSPKLKSRLSWTPKQYKFPTDFVLIIDSAEKKHHALCTGIKGFSFVRKSLRTMPGSYGDYSIQGFESKFAIELKRSSDFYSYIGTELKTKTIAKLRKLQKMDFAALIIESKFNELFIPPMQSTMSPESARSFIAYIKVRYGVHVFIDPDRDNLERFILDTAIWYYKMKREV